MSTFEEQMKIAIAASLKTETARRNTESDTLSAIKMSEATAGAKKVMLCFCECRADYCKHFCSSCAYESKLTSCPFCSEATEANEVKEVKEISTPVEFFEFGGMSMVAAYCPICQSESSLPIKSTNGRIQLTDGGVDGTCHTIACNCLRRSVRFSVVESRLFEVALLQPSLFGKGCSEMSVVVLRQYLQKLDPTTPYGVGDQYPQHLGQALFDAMRLTQPLTNFRVVLNADGDGVARTVVNIVAQ
jgi:hypothetical protein